MSGGWNQSDRGAAKEAARSREGKLTGEEKLWLGVVEQAMSDSLGKNRASIRPADIGNARHWLTSRNSSGVLALLDVDLDYWRERCIPELRRKWAAADARMAGKGAAASEKPSSKAKTAQTPVDAQRGSEAA